MGQEQNIYLPVKYCKGGVMGRLLQLFDFCCFDGGAKIILIEISVKNDLEGKIYVYGIYSFIACIYFKKTRKKRQGNKKFLYAI